MFEATAGQLGLENETKSQKQNKIKQKVKMSPKRKEGTDATSVKSSQITSQTCTHLQIRKSLAMLVAVM